MLSNTINKLKKEIKSNLWPITFTLLLLNNFYLTFTTITFTFLLWVNAFGGEVEIPISQKFSIYGYGQFNFCTTSKEKSFLSGHYLECSKGGSFSQFLFTPLFDFQITERLRALMSMEVLYAPEIEGFGVIGAEVGGQKGEVSYPSENSVSVKDVEKVEYKTKGADKVKFESFGEIDFQFVFLEYMLHHLAVVRAGKYLNPFGLFLEGRDAPIRYPFFFLPKIYNKSRKFIGPYNV